MMEEKVINNYLLSYDIAARSKDFMEGLLTGYSDAVVSDFECPWEGLFLIKSSVSVNELSNMISESTNQMKHVLLEVPLLKQGSMERGHWAFMGYDFEEK